MLSPKECLKIVLPISYLKYLFSHVCLNLYHRFQIATSDGIIANSIPCPGNIWTQKKTLINKTGRVK